MSSSILCPIHHSPIGGVCSDITCQNKNQALCMQCVTSPQCCIRSKNHQFIPLTEFVDTFFNFHLNELKTSSTTSTRVNTCLEYCKNCQEIVDNYHQENEKLGSAMIDIFQSFIDKIQKLFVEFNQNHIKYIQNKEKEMTDALSNVLEMFNYDYLECLDKEMLLKKIKLMRNQSDINETVIAMKQSIQNMKSDIYIRDMDKIKEVMNIKGDKVIKYLQKEFDTLKDEALQRFNLYTQKVKDEMFTFGSPSKIKLSEYKVIYDDTIDFTANSNFQTKKFTIFEHSNGNTLLAYPTSQNTIKLEYVDKFINEPTPTINPKTNMYVTQKANARDKYTYFTLQSHSGKIIDLIYYRSNINKDYLISSSEDCSVKIWDITKLNHYLTNVNEFYRSNCIKTLTGHQGIIISTLVFYDPLKNINYIVSLGYMDLIKVWDLEKGQLIKDIKDINYSRGTYDNLMCLSTINKENILFTGNSTKRLIKIWNFEKGEVIRVITYDISNKIVSMVFYSDLNRIYVIDEIGPCGYVEIKDNVNKLQLVKANFNPTGNSNGDIRMGCFRWNEELIGVYCKGGIVALYDVNSGECVDKVQLVQRNFISWAMGYMHHTKKKMLVLHSGDMHLKIFN